MYRYKEVEPVNDLKPFVQRFGILENTGIADVPNTFKIIADGCPGLIFQQQADAFADSCGNRFPNLYLHGLTTSHTENVATGKYSNLIVHLHPHALNAIFGLPASDLTNRFASLNDIVANNLTDQLLQSNSIDKKIALLTEFLRKLSLKNADDSQMKLEYFIRKINKPQTDFCLSGLRSALSLSERSMERMIKKHIGVSPKLFFRISRFQNGLNILRRKQFSSLTKVAYESNYFDQSHHIHDFKKFTGATPQEFLLRADEQITNFPTWKI